MQTDVKSGTAAAATSTAVTSFRSRVKAIALTYTASAGAIGSLYMLLPGEGLLCLTGIYVTNGTGTSATVFYG